MQYTTITVGLVYADKVNKNGWRISLDEFKKGVNNERVTEMLATKTLFITEKYNTDAEKIPNLIVCMKDIIGHVISIDVEDFMAVIEIDTEFCNNKLDEEYALYFSYIANNTKNKENTYTEITDLKIVSAVYMPKSLSAYND